MHEYEIDMPTSRDINRLLESCFPDGEYHGRDYFKQLPHHRLLAFETGQLVGHLGVDYRVMNLNGQPVRVFGVVDLCVQQDRRGIGIGRRMLEEFESIARESGRVNFLFLVADEPAFYEKLGYTTTELTTMWLKIDQHKNYGLGNEKISDSHFLYKSVSDKDWEDGELDLLGHMY